MLTAEELKESKDYAPLTNSELLYYRAQDKSLANQNKLLSVVQAGIGMERVTQMIQSVLNGMGSDQSSDQGYVSTQQGQLIQGLKDYAKAVQDASGSTYNGTVEDLYKYKYLTKSQADQANKAMSYIYSVLPANAKALLKSKSDLTDEGAIKLVSTLVASKVDNTIDFQATLVAGPTYDKARKSASSKAEGSNKDANSQLVEIANGMGGVEKTAVIDPGSGIQMSVTGRHYNMITDTSGKPIGNTSMSDMLLQSGLQMTIKDQNAITFGDQKISMDDLKNITYDNKGAFRALLPIKGDGTVDLDCIDRFEEAEKAINDLENPTEDQIKEIMHEKDVDDYFQPNGLPNPAKVKPFLIVEGQTTDALTGIGSSEYVKPVKKDNNKALDYIRDTLTTGTGKDRRVPDVDTFTAYYPGDWFGMYDHAYRGNVYIPIDTDLVSLYRTDKVNRTQEQIGQNELNYQNQGKILDFTADSTSADNL